MKSNSYLKNIIKQWDALNLKDKSLIVASLLAVIFSYLPTLEFDYVTQDQWRAFRYSILPQSPSFRAKACIDMLSHFYPLTGRPFVWLGECVEHSFVAKISDFIYLRPFVLTVVLITVLYLGKILGLLMRNLAIGIAVASIFVLAPGYSFMYLQSMPALMVLGSILLAGASFENLEKKLGGRGEIPARKLHYLITPFLFFISACMIYPAWAFIVIPLAMIQFGFNDQNPIKDKVRKFVSILLSYFIFSLIYYLIVKIFLVIIKLKYGSIQDLGDYTVSMQLSPQTLWTRIKEATNYFYMMPPSNFYTPHGITILLLSLYSFYIAKTMTKEQGRSNVATFLLSIFFFLFNFIFFYASISPWLFSHMSALSTRHLIPWYLLFSAMFLGMIWKIFQSFNKITNYYAVFIIAFIIFPIAANQNKLSFLEAEVSGIEIETMRLAIGKWLDEKGYLYSRFLLVVLPSQARLAYVERLFGKNFIAGENTVLSSSQNPVSLPWMFNALLRERNDHPMGKKIDLTYCAFDQTCTESNLLNGKVVLELTYGNKLIQSSTIPYIINLSYLTSKPVNPIFKKLSKFTKDPSGQMRLLQNNKSLP